MRITRARLRQIIKEEVAIGTEEAGSERSFDSDKDGNVDYDEFVNILKSLKAADLDSASTAELSLVGLKIDELIKMLSEGRTHTMRITRNQLRQIINEYAMLNKGQITRIVRDFDYFNLEDAEDAIQGKMIEYMSELQGDDRNELIKIAIDSKNPEIDVANGALDNRTTEDIMSLVSDGDLSFNMESIKDWIDQIAYGIAGSIDVSHDDVPATSNSTQSASHISKGVLILGGSADFCGTYKDYSPDDIQTIFNDEKYKDKKWDSDKIVMISCYATRGSFLSAGELVSVLQGQNHIEGVKRRLSQLGSDIIGFLNRKHLEPMTEHKMKITRKQLRQLISEELAHHSLDYIAEEQDNKRMGNWWQQPKKRKILIDRYVKGENRKSIIGKLKKAHFKNDTKDDIINEYYNEFILPQAIAIIENTWVVKADRPTGNEPSADYLKNAAAWYDPAEKIIVRPKMSTKNKIFITLGAIGLTAMGGGAMAAAIIALNSYVNVKGWRDHTFGHELAHAIDLELNLAIGFRWELGFQNPNSPQAKSNASVKNPKYLPHHNKSQTTRRYLHSDHALMSIFPCLSEDHPDYKAGDHAYSPPEIQANITQMRSRINRAYTADDVVAIRKSIKLKGARGKKIPHGILDDFYIILKDCKTEKSDAEIADAMNKIVG
jgi:hypothetical protein